jgi:hypothetical protein
MVIPRKILFHRVVTSTIEGSAVLICNSVWISTLIGCVVNPSFRANDPQSYFHRSWQEGSIITLRLALFFLEAVVCARCAVTLYSKVANSLELLRKDRLVSLISLGLMCLFGSVVFVLWYVHSFSVSVYSAIPSTLGGGRSQSVVFLIEKTGQQTAPIVVDSTGTRSVSYNLLLILAPDCASSLASSSPVLSFSSLSNSAFMNFIHSSLEILPLLSVSMRRSNCLTSPSPSASLSWRCRN